MKQKKMLVAVFCFTLLLGTNACREPTFNLQEACTDTFATDVVLDAGYLGFCSFGSEPQPAPPANPLPPQPMKVEITVDGLRFDAPTQTVGTTHVKTYYFNTDNSKDLTTNLSDRTFRVPLPRCGSYVVTVVVRGTDSSCFTCCNGKGLTVLLANSCADPNNTTLNIKGTPRFRIVLPQINANLQNPPPSQLNAKPNTEACSNCGC